MAKPIAVIFDPYLDTLGGGERYTLTLAQVLLEQNWRVELAWPDPDILKKAHQRFNLDLPSLKISPEYHDLFTQKHNLLDKRKALQNLDLVFFVSDGSVPVLFAKNTWLHYQVPFQKTNRFQIIDKLKLKSISQIIVNSQFTKQVIDKTLRTNRSKVIYPPVSTSQFKSGKKQNTILNVGRFASPSHSKRQDILIKTFKQLVNSGLENWQLTLAGSKKGSDNILKSLKQQARGLPIKFLVNPDFDHLRKTYSQASIYWHAAGYQVDQNINPESVEHFGITTVEAMASGCVPVVINKGGQPEIVTSESGFLWSTIHDLKIHTLKLIANSTLRKEMSQAAIKRSQHFNTQSFTDNIKTLLKDPSQ